jgi:hypothetical protein
MVIWWDLPTPQRCGSGSLLPLYIGFWLDMFRL